MTERHPPNFRRRLFAGESGCKILPGELSIPRQDGPQKGANDLTKDKAQSEGKLANQGNRAQRYPVNDAIENQSTSIATQGAHLKGVFRRGVEGFSPGIRQSEGEQNRVNYHQWPCLDMH